MIQQQTVIHALRELSRARMIQETDAHPDTWRRSLEMATDDRPGHHYEPVNPTDQEVIAATALLTSSLEYEGRWVTPASVAKKIVELRAVREGQAQDRLRYEIARNGQFIPEGLEGEPALEIEWCKTAMALFKDNPDMTREQAELAAWQAIGRQPPQLPATTVQGAQTALNEFLANFGKEKDN